MKILITGGCGFVGSNIAIFLKKRLKNVNVRTIDNLFRKGSRTNRIRLKKFGRSQYKGLTFFMNEKGTIYYLTDNGIKVYC